MQKAKCPPEYANVYSASANPATATAATCASAATGPGVCSAAAAAVTAVTCGPLPPPPVTLSVETGFETMLAPGTPLAVISTTLELVALKLVCARLIWLFCRS